MKKNEGSSFFGTKAKDEGLRSKKRRSFAIANSEDWQTRGGFFERDSGEKTSGQAQV